MSRRKTSRPTGPYLTRMYAVPDRLDGREGFPLSLPFVRTLDLDLDRPVTFFVGENGTGKSTLLEAIAELSGFHSTGGGRHDLSDHPGVQHEERSSLAPVLRPSFRQRPRDGFFFRAETFVNFASLLDLRNEDPDFNDGDGPCNPYARYGGESLHGRSHGEAFLQVFEHRVGAGLFLLDEPEAALSPQRQLALLRLMWMLVEEGGTQLVIATHAPVLLTFPGARIVDFDDPALPFVDLEATRHYQVTKGILDSPERYWKHLQAEEPDASDRS